jgi:hypothetical protein
VRSDRTYSLAKVERILKLHVVVGGTKYTKPWGHRVGGGPWDTAAIVEPTPERVEKMRLSRLVSKASALRNRLEIPNTTQEIEAFIAAVEPWAKKP